MIFSFFVVFHILRAFGIATTALALIAGTGITGAARFRLSVRN
jgi:hypothetical protein